MPTPTIITAELRSWWRSENNFFGKIYGDKHRIFPDGIPHMIVDSNIKSIIEYRDDFIVKTNAWTYQLLKSEECK